MAQKWYADMLSFIIPSRDEEKYIIDCVKSIVAQDTSEKFEVIVVDNASTDGTSDIVEKFFANDARVRVMRETKAGINYARQAGFLASVGDVVIFIDADIRLSKDWSRSIVAKLRSDDKVVAISGPYEYYDAARWYINPMTHFFQLIFQAGAWASNQLLHKNTVLIAGDMAIKRTALTRIGGFDVRYVFYREDVDTAMRLSSVGRVDFDMDFPVSSSARRFNQTGLWKMVVIYFYHYVVGSFLKRPSESGYKEYR